MMIVFYPKLLTYLVSIVIIQSLKTRFPQSIYIINISRIFFGLIPHAQS